ncbi:hypothetical protein DYB32_005554 [Aphanomyces invadans]|uniref:HECT domain-containing protein n=1 Tax=Aphanomyces invadans TaxID=157072 RepID=A0A418AU89_9STRA|nr:hypothetical protein DYB32_005554 [Aphanomyces invadans]
MDADDIQWIRAPFSSLREESVLMEMYAKLEESSSAANVAMASPNSNITITSTSTCVNGVTMSLEELNQDADVARLQLFARHAHGSDASDDAHKDAPQMKSTKKRAKASATAGVNEMSLVLKEPSLLGQSPEAIVSTRRQAKKGMLIERMFQAMDKCMITSETLPSCTSVLPQASTSNGSTAFASPRVIEPPPAERSTFVLKLFSVVSCRMQLTLLKSMASDIRRACVLELVAAILDFPALALSNISQHSAEDATLHAMYSFAKDTSEVLNDGMLLMLALGVSSGQARFLLHTVSKLLDAPPELVASAEPACAIHYDHLFHRLETYEPPTVLGELGKASLVQQVRFKPTTSDEASQQQSKVSIATDGTYLYSWCTIGGLKKIGTGNGGSITGRLYSQVPASSYKPYFGTKRPVLRAVCGAVTIVTLTSTMLETPPVVQDAFGGRDGQLLVVFKTGNVLQDIVFDSLERISLPSTAVVVHAAFGTFIDVTSATQQLTSEANGAFTDALSPLPHAELLVVLWPLPGETDVRVKIVQKGDAIFETFPAIESTSIVCVGEWVYLNMTCSATNLAQAVTAVEFLQISTTDLRVKNVVYMETGKRDGVRLQWTTEGDFLYDVRFRADKNAVDVYVHDTPSLELVRSVTAPALAAALFGNAQPHPVPCYTNGRALAVTASDGVDVSPQCFQVNLQRGRTLPPANDKSSSCAPTAAVCFDAAANMLWSIAPSRHTIECYRNNGSVVSIRDKRQHKAVVSTAQAWLLVRESNSVGRRWVLGILAKLHEWAVCELKQTSVHEGVLLAVDICDETFQVLLQCIASYADRFCRGDALQGWEEYVLMASLVVLTANVRRMNVKDNAQIVQLVLDSRLSATLSSLVRFPDMEHPVVQASLHLYKASLDIFYHGPVDQLVLVTTYLEALTSNALHASELAILKLLLQRLTNVETLHDLVKEPKSIDIFEVLLAHSVQCHLMQRDDVARDLVALIYSMTQSLLWGYHRQRIPQHRAWTCFEGIVQASVHLVQTTKSDHVAQLEHSILGQVLPLLFTAMQHFSWQPAKATFEHMCELLGQLVDCIGPLNKLTNPSDIHNETVVETTAKVVKHMESPHDYLNNMHVLTELAIPGASTITITFDRRSRTEAAYDYVTFYKDATQTEFYGVEKYSGRGDDHNWPGMDNCPPLVIEAESCHVLFHTDGSGVDWGYKFTAVGVVESQVTCLSLPWLVHVEETLLLVVTSLATTLIRGKLFSPLSSGEITQSLLLNSRLLHGGKQQSSDHVVQFLRDLVDPADDSTAHAVVKELKKRTVQDQGSIVHINRAVRAVAVAILHHNLWGMDVYEIGQTQGSSPIAAQVLQAWKTAQKMRQWFDIGDAADATVHRASSSGRPTGLKRQPSAYKGQSEEAIMQLCQNVVDRSLFLLEFTPASFSFVRAAKLRWNLLAKYTTAIHRKNSWMHLVNELNAATELKSMLDYRRASMERLNTPKTVTELVLEFVQSDVDVGEMQTILETRNKRAQSRVLGMSTVAKALGASSSGRLQHVLLEGLAKTMREIGLEDACSTSLHFFNSLNGCDELKRKELSEAVAQCLKACADILGNNKLSKWADESPTASAALISSALKAIAMDYDVRDSYLLYDSKVLPHILRLLPSENVRIRRVAQSIIRVLLSHFVAIPDTEEVSTDVPNLSAFQKQLLAAVRLQLEGIVASVQQQSDPHTALCLTRNQAGYCAPFVSVLPNHSLSFWLFVEEQACQYALKVGDEVRRGPHWISTQDEDGGEPGTGTIVSIPSPTTVQVKWFATNKALVYTWDPSLPLYEVQLVDEGVGGMVFLHGNRNLVSDTEEMVAWSHYGLFLTDEGQIKYVVSSGADKDTIFESTDAVNLNAWNHVCVVKDGIHLKLYLNGALDSQHVLDDAKKHSTDDDPPSHCVIESVHPCMGHGDVNRWPLSFPGASRLVVTFDPLTQLDKSNGDYMCFFASADETEVWGLPMYNHSFPGVNENRYSSCAVTWVLSHYTLDGVLSDLTGVV